MRALLALDPGIDGTGAAVFELNQFEAALGAGKLDYDAAAAALVATDLWATDAKASTLDRVGELARQTTECCLYWGVADVVIEVPAKDGAYFGRQKRQRSKGSINASAEAKLNRAIGALAAGAVAASAQVIEQRASATRKDWRFEQVDRLLQRIGYKGRITHDIRDAIWLGATELVTNRGAYLNRRAG